MRAPSERSNQLSEKELAFIEKNGQHYEKTYGIARIGGRILGLLMIMDRPQPIEGIGRTLGVSHGSISANLNWLIKARFCLMKSGNCRWISSAGFSGPLRAKPLGVWEAPH